MFCTKCGANIRGDIGFCTVCGAPVAVTPGAVPRRRKGRAVAIALAVAVAVVALGVAIGYWFYSAPPAVDPGAIETIVVSDAGTGSLGCQVVRA